MKTFTVIKPRDDPQGQGLLEPKFHWLKRVHQGVKRDEGGLQRSKGNLHCAGESKPEGDVVEELRVRIMVAIHAGLLNVVFLIFFTLLCSFFMTHFAREHFKKLATSI